MKLKLFPIIMSVSLLASCASQAENSGVTTNVTTAATSAPAATAPETSAPASTQPPKTTVTEAETAATSPKPAPTTTVAETSAPATTAPTTTTAPATAAAPKTTATSATEPPPKKTGSLSDIVINEVCAKNKSSLSDSDGDSPDWLELYNKGSLPVSLEGCGLTDDASSPAKWVFPDVDISPQGYLIVFCSDKDLYGNELHANFKISSGSETLTFSSPNGDKIDSVTVSDMSEDQAFGRLPDGGEFSLVEATPLKSNSGAKELSAPPVFDKPSGFYSSTFSLNITAPEGSVIYYTTDGSLPTSSSAKFSSPISIKDRSNERAVLTYKRGTTVDSGSEQFPNTEFEKATIVRAMAVDKNGVQSAVSTATYFVGEKIAQKYKNVSVISVVSDPDGLYNQKTGIYVAGDVFTQWRKQNPSGVLDGSTPANFNQRGRDWEREAHIDYFKDGQLEFSSDAGMRVHGGWSRNSQQKSLKFYFRSDYGESKLKYELFENNRAYDSGKTVKEYKRFMIRNGGNDSFLLLYKDAWTQACVKNFPFATQDNSLAIAFLDGEYWGIYTMMELYDDNYIEENFGVNADNAVMIKAGELEEGNASDYDLWDSTVKFISQNDMSVTDNYKKASSMMDLDSFSEYVAMNVYIGNEDWVWGNWAVWRVRDTSDKPYEDGRWRFMCYDTEYSMNLYNSGDDYRYDILSQLAGGDGHLGPMLKSLLKNSEFSAKFVLACEDMMNIAFNPDSAAALMDSFHKTYSPFMSQHFRRYIFWQSERGVENNRNGYKKWLTNRRSYFPEQMSKALGTPSRASATLTITKKGNGTVKINGYPITFTNGKWTGKYISRYKITVEAQPAKGQSFTGWSGGYDGTGSSISWSPSGSLEITANFS